VHGKWKLGARGIAALLLVVGVAGVGGSSASAGDSADVCSSGCTYTSIQAAIDDASAGDTISVAAGTYTENVRVDKAVTLEGAGADDTTIVATDANATPLIFATSNATVRGFTITHDYTSSELSDWNFNNNGVTFNQSTSHDTLEDCKVTLNRNGVYLNTTQDDTLDGNTIENNRTGVNLTGDFGGTKITGNTISGNWTVGLVLYGTNNPGIDLSGVTVSGNTFDGNWYSEIEVKGPSHSSTSTFTGTLDVTDNTFGDDPVTYTTSDDSSLDEPGFSALKPDVDGIGGSATEPADALPTLRIYGTPNATLKYDHAKTLVVGGSLPAYTSIQSAVDDAASGDTVRVDAGTYSEDVTVDKPLTLDGARAGVDARGRSGDESKVGSVAITSSDVVVDGFTFTSSGANQVNVSSTTTLSGLEIQNDVFGGYSSVGLTAYDAGDILVQHDQFNAASGSAEAIQLRASSVQGGCDGAQVLDNAFADATTNGSADVNLSCTGSNSKNVVVSGNKTSGGSAGSSFTSFSGVVDGISVKNNSGSTDGSAIFFFGGVSGSATIEDNTFSGSGNGVAIRKIDAESTGTFTITDNTLSGNTHSISVGAGSLGTGGSVVAHGNDLSAGVENESGTTIDAAGNWWGALAGPGTVAGANTAPWCTVSACSSSSDDALLTSLSISGASLSPSFSSSTTSYTASVGNGTSSVSVAKAVAPGATAVVSGGSGLSVGANTVKVTVTSLDATKTRVYTVTVTRAAASSGDGNGGGGTTTTTSTTTTTTGGGGTTTTPSPTPTPTPTPQPTQVATVVNRPETVQASPAQAGTVAVVVAPPAYSTGGTTASAPVSVALSWNPGAFTAPVTVQVTPKPQEAAAAGAAPAPPNPVAGGFSVGDTVVQVNVTADGTGQAVTQFAAPLVLHVSAIAKGEVPGYSHDGTTWTTIPRLSSPELPAGQADGYFVNADGSVDIYTRHATLFGLLVDTKAPARPAVHARITGAKLRLTIHAKDNLRIASYQVRVNGKLIKGTKHAYVVLKARSGRYQVVALDAAGNRSKASKQVVVVRSNAKHRSFRLA
jgi:parallel beta-helix repeat protein